MLVRKVENVLSKKEYRILKLLNTIVCMTLLLFVVIGIISGLFCSSEDLQNLNLPFLFEQISMLGYFIGLLINLVGVFVVGIILGMYFILELYIPIENSSILKLLILNLGAIVGKFILVGVVVYYYNVVYRIITNEKCY